MKMLNALREKEKPSVICGDGRHDSVGNSAKYGAYSIVCYNQPQLLHFELVQVFKISSNI